jgi:hypothetical protein
MSIGATNGAVTVNPFGAPEFTLLKKGLVAEWLRKV